MLPAYDLDGRTLSIREVAEYAREAERCGFDSVWVSDHFQGDANAPGGASGRYDAIVTLAYLAANTQTIGLGSLVLANVFRLAPQLAREVLSLANIADGRLVLGLGSGGREEEYQTFGFAHQHRVGRLRETLTVLPRLLAGETVNHAGESLQLENASLLLSETIPPIWVAAFGPRMRELAAELADGWITAWHGPDLAPFEHEVSMIREARARAQTIRGDAFEIAVGVRLLPITGAERAELDARMGALNPTPPPAFWDLPLQTATITGTAEELARSVMRYHLAGAQTVILNLSLLPTLQFEMGYLERAAALGAHLV
jgi:alkanesulfonate monooxygenase SsuD/methylene tetrahydromethanopterin reductase-like flavin-dependent oxidoreductase (luciferase family)